MLVSLPAGARVCAPWSHHHCGYESWALWLFCEHYLSNVGGGRKHKFGVVFVLHGSNQADQFGGIISSIPPARNVSFGGVVSAFFNGRSLGVIDSFLHPLTHDMALGIWNHRMPLPSRSSSKYFIIEHVERETNQSHATILNRRVWQHIVVWRPQSS
jgi:hypothetical protein